MCPDITERSSTTSSERWTWALAAVGIIGALVALIAVRERAQSAATQTWVPFVLVVGLLLIGMVAEEDGLFRAAGAQLARAAPNGASLFMGATLLIVVVTATLNLDTSVVFLTPVLIAAGHQRGGGERALLYGSLLLANASSLFLPGSNLTNLIVLGHRPLSGEAFLALMWPAAVAAPLVTACCIALWERRDLVATNASVVVVERPCWGIGIGAVTLAVVLVVALRNPAVPVLIVGVMALGARVAQRRVSARRAMSDLGMPVLVGLFGVTIGLGALGREWSGPATLLSHAGSIGTAAFSAILALLCNNLPAASLLAARAPQHPAQLLVGLNVGPNVFASGSLAWFLWRNVARSSGATPSLRQASKWGIVVVPLSMATALLALFLHGST